MLCCGSCLCSQFSYGLYWQTTVQKNNLYQATEEGQGQQQNLLWMMSSTSPQTRTPLSLVVRLSRTGTWCNKKLPSNCNGWLGAVQPWSQTWDLAEQIQAGTTQATEYDGDQSIPCTDQAPGWICLEATGPMPSASEPEGQHLQSHLSLKHEVNW